MQKKQVYTRISAIQGLAFNSLKQLISWSNDFKVDQPQIDTQHESLFKLAVEASELSRSPADKDKLITKFEEFGILLDEHFRDEEDVLVEIGYPMLKGHRAEHKALLSEFKFIRQRLSTWGGEPAFQEKAFVVLNFMLGVTVGHILHSDVNYARCMQKDLLKQADICLPDDGP